MHVMSVYFIIHLCIVPLLGKNRPDANACGSKKIMFDCSNSNKTQIFKGLFLLRVHLNDALPMIWRQAHMQQHKYIFTESNLLLKYPRYLYSHWKLPWWVRSVWLLFPNAVNKDLLEKNSIPYPLDEAATINRKFVCQRLNRWT